VPPRSEGEAEMLLQPHRAESISKNFLSAFLSCHPDDSAKEKQRNRVREPGRDRRSRQETEPLCKKRLPFQTASRKSGNFASGHMPEFKISSFSPETASVSLLFPKKPFSKDSRIHTIR
jgi:hypothetical protein